jgi:hypothetical protein
VLTRIHHLFQFRPTLNPVDTHPSSFLKIYFNKILPSVPPSSKWSLYFMYRCKNSICISVLPLVCHMHYPSHSPLFDHPYNIWQGIQSMISLFYPSKVQKINSIEVLSIMFRFVCCWIVGWWGTSVKYRMLPEDGLSKTKICWSLQCSYMIFRFLMILKV